MTLPFPSSHEKLGAFEFLDSTPSYKVTANLHVGLPVFDKDRSLIVQAKRKLHQPGGIELRTDDAERCIALRLAWDAKLDAIEDIEELRSELKLKTFRELDTLEHGEV